MQSSACGGSGAGQAGRELETASTPVALPAIDRLAGAIPYKLTVSANSRLTNSAHQATTLTLEPCTIVRPITTVSSVICQEWCVLLHLRPCWEYTHS